MGNRVDDTGATQPGGRNSQDAWAIYKNRKTGERSEATRQNDSRPWKYKKETNRGDKREQQKPENGRKKRKQAKNATWRTKRGRHRWQGQGAGITQQAPDQKTDMKRRNGRLASIRRTKKAPARRKRAPFKEVDPRTQRATGATQTGNWLQSARRKRRAIA